MNYFNKSSQEVNKVYKTNDLSIFKEIEGNRPPNPQHIKRLTQSINDYGLLCNPILVNEKMEIIDGQHRLLAAKEAKSYIFYIVLDGYSLNQVHALNLNQKNWTKKDFLDGYAKMNINSYVKLKEFYRKNKDFGLTDCISMCSNTTQGGSNSSAARISHSNSNAKEIFEEGTWLGKDFNLAQNIADMIRTVKPFYQGYARSVFVKTLIGLIIYKPEFDINEFTHKLRLQPNSLKDMTTISETKLLIEDIYNYRSRNKVNLRY